jgi:hypothetical protein
MPNNAQRLQDGDERSVNVVTEDKSCVSMWRGDTCIYT